jgi:ABC-type uncharacterized transport system permease subunit
VPLHEQVARAQFVGQVLPTDAPLNPTDANLRTAGFTVLIIAGLGILLAVRNPKFALGIMTGTLGASILAGYVALSATGQPTAWTLTEPSSSS